jgi:hypothetical protein
LEVKTVTAMEKLVLENAFDPIKVSSHSDEDVVIFWK